MYDKEIKILVTQRLFRKKWRKTNSPKSSLLKSPL